MPHGDDIFKFSRNFRCGVCSTKYDMNAFCRLSLGLLLAHGGRQRFASSIAVDAVHRTGPRIASLREVAITPLEHRIHRIEHHLHSHRAQ